ncbi:hypothetical protein BCR43DRAFT_80357 [Syncephalastrum racemosum]|uniref:Pentacotripeptide-repeat region of PRORP domain-containing protein n=1 Tax=Syncephalastrum racemosum TaxID=13706 RepID=A0A1X2H2R5_SYNRA|nr:hypothetical protein BCR43DRAFT_80357 [Syncephalastrum racemosum]
MSLTRHCCRQSGLVLQRVGRSGTIRPKPFFLYRAESTAHKPQSQTTEAATNIHKIDPVKAPPPSTSSLASSSSSSSSSSSEKSPSSVSTNKTAPDTSYEKPILNFDQPFDSLWKEFTDALATNRTLLDQDYILLCGRIKRDLPGDAAVEHLQRTLRAVRDNNMDPRTFKRGCNMLVHVFCAMGDVKSARLVVDGMVRSNYRPDIVTVRTLIHGIRMQEVPSSSKVAAIIDLYENLAKQNMWIFSSEHYQVLLESFVAEGDIENSKRYYMTALRRAFTIDVSLFNVMINAYRQAREPDAALSVYKAMQKRDVQPNSATYHMLLSLLKTHGKPQQYQRIYRDLQKSDVRLNASHYEAMGVSPVEALKEMHKLGVKPAVRDYNTFFSIHIKNNEFQEAKDLFDTMLKDRIEPDRTSYSIVMDSVLKDIHSPVQSVFDLYQDMLDRKLKPDVVVYTTLIQACARENKIEQAFDILKDMEAHRVNPNEYTFNALLGLLARMENGNITENIHLGNMLWKKMSSLRVTPEIRSYNNYLALLSKAVQPVSSWEPKKAYGSTLYMEPSMTPETTSMIKLYYAMKRRLQPDFISYAIMINTLVHAGHLRAAMRIYEDSRIARTVLSVSVYNTIMIALEKARDYAPIMKIWHEMKEQHVQPDWTSYSLAMEACERLEMFKSLDIIRADQRKDWDRLMDLEERREDRMHHSSSFSS